MFKSKKRCANSPFSTFKELLEVSHEYYPEKTLPFQDCLIVSMQHMLGTTVDMFRAMKKLGLKDAILGSKLYSDNLSCIKEFERLGFVYVGSQKPLGYGLYSESIVRDIHLIWQKALKVIQDVSIDTIIILDDGGDLLLHIPSEVYDWCQSEKNFLVGIEQTNGGANRTFFGGLALPIINVAGSGIKKRFEYQWVAEKVIEALFDTCLGKIQAELRSKPHIGIFGYGTMGRAVAKGLSDKGYQISVYDSDVIHFPENENITQLFNPSLLVSESDVIIGCTGQDVTASCDVFEALRYSLSPKLLVSTSSKDIEFNYLLHKYQEKIKQNYYTPDTLQTIVYRNYYEIPIKVLRGGFPINFQNTVHCIAPKKIWPTRGALLLACLMAKKHQRKFEESKAGIFQLDPRAQLLIYHQYAKIMPDDPQLEELLLLSDDELCNYFSCSSHGQTLFKHEALSSNLDLSLSKMPTHIYVKDIHGVYLYCNSAFVRASCMGSRRSIIGKTDLDLWPSNAAAIIHTDQEVIAEQKEITLIEHVETQKAKGRYLSIKRPFFHKGELVGIIGNSVPLDGVI